MPDGFIQGLDRCNEDFSIPTEKINGKVLLESRPLKKWKLLRLYMLCKMLHYVIACIMYISNKIFYSLSAGLQLCPGGHGDITQHWCSHFVHSFLYLIIWPIECQ